MKQLILLRGLPGSGKSTLAETLTPTNVATDNYPGLYTEGGFQFPLLHIAHEWCKNVVEKWMQNGEQVIAVHNTFTTQSEMNPYLFLADAYGYRVISLIVENRHGSKSIHGVPDETIQKMRGRFQISL